MMSMFEQWKCACGWHNMVLRRKCRECGATNPADSVLERVGEAVPAKTQDPVEEAFNAWVAFNVMPEPEGDLRRLMQMSFLAGALHEREQSAFLIETMGGQIDAEAAGGAA